MKIKAYYQVRIQTYKAQLAAVSWAVDFTTIFNPWRTDLSFKWSDKLFMCEDADGAFYGSKFGAKKSKNSSSNRPHVD